MALIYAAVMLGLAWMAWRLRMPAVNGVTVFVVPWTIALLIADFPGVLGNPLSYTTWLMIWCASLALVVGVLSGWVLVGLRELNQSSNRPRAIEARRLVTWHLWFVALLAGYIALQVTRLLPVFSSAGGWEALFTGNGSELKAALVDGAALSARESFGPVGLVLAAVGYALFFGNLSLFTGAILWRAGRPLLGAIPIGLSAIYSLVTLQRTTFIVAVLVMFACWTIANRGTKSAVWRNLLRPRTWPKKSIMAGATIAAVGAATVLYPLIVRNTGTSNPVGLKSIANYLVSGVSGLNVRIPQWTPPVVDGVEWATPGYGSYTFSGFFNILDRLGLPVPTSPTNLDFYDVTLFGAPTTTNIGTVLVDFYFDFGWLGIVALPLALGLLAGTMHRAYVRSGSYVYVPGISFLFATFIWSFFTGALLGDFRFIVLCVLGGFVLQWIADKQHQDHPEGTSRPNSSEGARPGS